MSEAHEEESAAPPSLVTWDQAEVLGKRTFDDVEAVIGPNKKLRAQEHFRLLVPAKCAGSVIGKGGENIKKVREACPGDYSDLVWWFRDTDSIRTDWT